MNRIGEDTHILKGAYHRYVSFLILPVLYLGFAFFEQPLGFHFDWNFFDRSWQETWSPMSSYGVLGALLVYLGIRIAFYVGRQDVRSLFPYFAIYTSLILVFFQAYALGHFSDSFPVLFLFAGNALLHKSSVKDDISKIQVLNLGLLMGLAFCFSPQYILFFPLLLLVMPYKGIFNLNSILILLLGFLGSCSILFVVLLGGGRVPVFEHIAFGMAELAKGFLDYSQVSLEGLLPLLLLVLMSVHGYVQMAMRPSLSWVTKEYCYLLGWQLVVLIILLLLFPFMFARDYLLLSTLFSLLAGRYFSSQTWSMDRRYIWGYFVALFSLCLIDVFIF